MAINHFVADTDNEMKVLQEECNKINIKAVVCKHWSKGGEGTIDLANISIWPLILSRERS